MEATRRGFIQFLARGTGLLLVSWVVVRTVAAHLFHAKLPPRSVAPGKQRWVMVIDLAKCDGCRDCTKACTKMHLDRKSTRLNSSHLVISYAVFCLKKKKK